MRSADARLLHRRDRIAAADDRRALHAGDGLRDARSCPARTRRSRTRPSVRSRPPSSHRAAHRRTPSTVVGPMSSPMRSPIAGSSTPSVSDRRAGLELRRDDVIDGQQQLQDRAPSRASMMSRAASSLSSSTSDLPTGLPMRLEERVRHRAADQQAIDARDQVLDDLDLVRHLGAAEDRRRTGAPGLPIASPR